MTSIISRSAFLSAYFGMACFCVSDLFAFCLPFFTHFWRNILANFTTHCLNDFFLVFFLSFAICTSVLVTSSISLVGFGALRLGYRCWRWFVTSGTSTVASCFRLWFWLVDSVCLLFFAFQSSSIMFCRLSCLLTVFLFFFFFVEAIAGWDGRWVVLKKLWDWSMNRCLFRW